MKPAPEQGGYAEALKAPPPPEPEEKCEQEGKGGMVPLGARNLGPSNATASDQAGAQQASRGQAGQQQSSATRGRGTGRGGAHCYGCKIWDISSPIARIDLARESFVAVAGIAAVAEVAVEALTEDGAVCLPSWKA